MTRLVYATVVDPTGRSGENLATANLLAALGAHPRLDLRVICAEPIGDHRIPGLERALERAVFLPPKRARGLGWQLRAQLHMLRALVGLRDFLRGGALAARLSPAQFAAPLAARTLGVPYLLLARGLTLRNVRANPRYGQLGFAAESLVRWNARSADLVFAAYAEVVDWLDALRGPGRAGARILANAVDVARFAPTPRDAARAALPGLVEPGDFAIGFAGSVRERHGLEPLVRALGLLHRRGRRDARVLVLGEGPLLERLRELARSVGVADAVRFTGFVAQDRLALHLSACDVLYGVVDPGFVTNPIKVYEYLACERPVLTTVDRTLRFVASERLGVAIDTLEPEAIAAGLEELRALGPEARADAGARGRAYVARHHTWAHLAEAITSGAEELLRRSAAAPAPPPDSRP